MSKIIVALVISFSSLAFIPKQFSMNFEQEFKSLVNGEKRKASGTFEYMYPGNLRIDQTSPEKLLYVSNSKKTWIFRAPLFDDEPAEVTISKGQDSGLSTFFDILKNGLETNAYYQVEKKAKFAKLIFNKNAIKDTGIKITEINFKDDLTFSKVDNILIKYDDGREVLLTVSKINENVKYDKAHFVFLVPKGAKVLQN